MTIGPITIRWTKDIKAEQAERDKARHVSAALTEALLHDNRRYKAILRRWGLSESLIGLIGDKAGKGAHKRSMTPKGPVATI